MGYLVLLEIGLIASHIAANKHHFTNIFFSFAITFTLKKLMKSIDEKEKSSMIGLAGYSVMLTHIVMYLADVIKSGSTPSSLQLDDIEDYIKSRQIEGAFDLDKNFKPNLKPNFKSDIKLDPKGNLFR